MLNLIDMTARLLVALILGGLMGLERQLIGKEAGVRTCMTVSGGAAIFSMIALALPYLTTNSPEEMQLLLAHNSGFFSIIANIVVGIGFLGAGIILKTEDRVHSLTTAAIIWAAAAVGVLIGIGLIWFGLISVALISGGIYVIRRLGLFKEVTGRK